MTINFVVSCMTTAEISTIKCYLSCHWITLFISDVIFMPYVLAANWHIHQESVKSLYLEQTSHKLQIELVSGFHAMVGHKVIMVNSFTFCWSFLSKE